MRPISVLSLETLWAPVDAQKDGQPYDPTGDTVLGATVVHPSQPGEDDWRPAVWQDTADQHRYAIGTQVGPPILQLEPNVTYGYWVQFADDPDTPIIFSGTFRTF